MKKQTLRLLDYLEAQRSVTPMEAWFDLGIYRLSACVFKLRKLGHNIITSRVTVKNRFGEDCIVANYRLIEG